MRAAITLGGNEQALKESNPLSQLWKLLRSPAQCLRKSIVKVMAGPWASQHPTTQGIENLFPISQESLLRVGFGQEAQGAVLLPGDILGRN